MNQNFNFSQNQMDLLMQMASKKMGTNPERLKQQMQSGDMNSLLSGLAPDQRAQLERLMNDPAAVESLISSPKVQQLLKGFMGR